MSLAGLVTGIRRVPGKAGRLRQAYVAAQHCYCWRGPAAVARPLVWWSTVARRHLLPALPINAGQTKWLVNGGRMEGGAQLGLQRDTKLLHRELGNISSLGVLPSVIMLCGVMDTTHTGATEKAEDWLGAPEMPLLHSAAASSL